MLKITFFDRRIKVRYNNGMTNKVNTVENINPHTIADATGPHNNDLPPRPTASENKPAIVVNEVIIMESRGAALHI